MEETVLSLADYPNPFWRSFTVTPEDIDGFGHANNAVYLRWMDATIWDHTRHVGLSEEVCLKLNRGMAAV